MAGSIFVLVGNPTWLKLIATPRSVVRHSQLTTANLILPETRHFMQDHLHVHS